MFNGKVIVRQDAQKTDAEPDEQEPAALATRPSSTPSRSSRSSPTTSSARTARRSASSTPRPLFYLRSRGIGEAAARALLTYAFAGDVAERIRIPARARGRRAASSGDRLSGRRRGGRAMSDRRCARRAAAYDVAAHPARTSRSSRTKVHGKPLVYLDNAASTQKPLAVIDAERDVYEKCYANVHRGVHWLSVARDRRLRGRAREGPRASSTRASPHEIIFIRGTTEAINLVAQTSGRAHVGAGDEILVTGLEHHSNIVPWQMLCEEKGARLSRRPHRRHGRHRPRRARAPAHAAHEARLGRATSRTRSARSLRSRASPRSPTPAGIPVLVDGAQAVPHMPVDVQDARLRLLRLLGPQDLRADRHRRPLRQDARCSRRCRPGRAAAT